MDVRRVISGLLIASSGGLVAVVLAVGILSIGAELVGTWTWFFRLERTTAAVVPVTAALLVLAVSSALTLVFTVTD